VLIELKERKYTILENVPAGNDPLFDHFIVKIV